MMTRERVVPRAYQEGALVSLMANTKTSKCSLIVAAAGLGKTVIAAEFVCRVRTTRRNARALFLAHDTDILEQCRETCETVLGLELTYGNFNGIEKDYHDVDILFATFQTMREWKLAFHEDEFDLVIVDEAHHSEAVTFKDVITYFEPWHLLGLTATPDRMDEKNIREIFGPEIVSISLEEGIANGWLTDVDYRVVSDHINRAVLARIADEIGKDVKLTMRDLNETLFIGRRDEEIAKIILSEDRRGVIFCENIEHAERFARYLPDTRVCHSKRSAAYNKEALQDFRAGTVQFLLAVDMFNEGIDLPRTELIVFLRCTNSTTIFLQQLGRGLRIALGKLKVVVLDFVANWERIEMVRDFGERIKSLVASRKDKGITETPGDSWNLSFSQEYIDILEVVRRLKRALLTIADIPELLVEYNHKKNPKPAEQVLAGTREKIFWVCSKCNHGWEAAGQWRYYQGTGCPACKNLVATPTNNLTVTDPELAKEYDRERNTKPPEKVIAGTPTKLHWICSKCKHRWQAAGSSRSRGIGCPGCSGRVPTPQHNLTTTHPHLICQYDRKKNPKPPEEVLAGSHHKIHWVCSTCGHEWLANIQGTKANCPTCSGRAPTPTNNLAFTNPELIKEYHKEKNLKPPEEVLAGSHHKIHWVCSTCGHEWQASAEKRTKCKSGCPACRNRTVTPTNNLAFTNPELIKEYHKEKNLKPPDQIMASSHSIIHWICSICGHEWQTEARTRAIVGNGCRICGYKKRTETRKRNQMK